MICLLVDKLGIGKSRAALPPLEVMEEAENTAANAAALELEDRDDGGDSTIMGHQEKE